MRRHLIRFCQDEDGGALVEFAVVLPMMLVVLGLSIEGSRTFWSYQTTITGVRDAARYLSRVVPQDVCAAGGGTQQWDARLTEIVRETQAGDSLFPSGVEVESVTSGLRCEGGAYRTGDAPVATVTANLRIEYPFAGLFGLVGVEVATVSTLVRDETRVLGS